TLVFMQYKVIGSQFVKLPIRTVDVGYGLDRYAWLSQGSMSAFHSIYGELLDKVFKLAGISVDYDLLARVAKFSATISLEKTGGMLEARRRIAELVGVDAKRLNEILLPVENAFAVTDHTKCLAFILSEG
ncbi:hypothetical protein EI021_28660, partial [Escherichia coli]